MAALRPRGRVQAEARGRARRPLPADAARESRRASARPRRRSRTAAPELAAAARRPAGRCACRAQGSPRPSCRACRRACATTSRCRRRGGSAAEHRGRGVRLAGRRLLAHIAEDRRHADAPEGLVAGAAHAAAGEFLPALRADRLARERASSAERGGIGDDRVALAARRVDVDVGERAALELLPVRVGVPGGARNSGRASGRTRTRRAGRASMPARKAQRRATSIMVALAPPLSMVP